MSRRLTPLEQDRTPQARLSEAGMHGIVGYQLAQATIVTDQVFDECVGGEGGLHRVEFTILALVQGNPDVTARQLARALSVTPPNIAIWLDRLESRDLITRTRGTTDARVQHLRVTRSATPLLDGAMRRVHAGERETLVTLTAAEHAMLIELLHKVALARKR